MAGLDVGADRRRRWLRGREEAAGDAVAERARARVSRTTLTQRCTCPASRGATRRWSRGGAAAAAARPPDRPVWAAPRGRRSSRSSRSASAGSAPSIAFGELAQRRRRAAGCAAAHRQQVERAVERPRDVEMRGEGFARRARRRRPGRARDSLPSACRGRRGMAWTSAGSIRGGEAEGVAGLVGQAGVRRGR